MEGPQEVAVVRRRSSPWLWAAAVAVLSLSVPRGLAGEAGGEKKYEITASRYKFEPAQLTVEEGDTVRLVLRSADTDHGFAIPALKVKAAIPKGGATVDLSFVATRSGRFPFACSEYCGTGHKAMTGELLVNARTR
jgi:cytochrome c oxidase subunit 2